MPEEERSWAPRPDPLPANVTGYRALPLLTKCSECKKPLGLLEAHYRIEIGGNVRSGLCHNCAMGVECGD